MQWIQGCENNQEESQYVGGGGGGGAGKGAKFSVVYLLERSDGLAVRVFVSLFASYCCWDIDFRGMYAELGLNRILRLSRFINPCHRCCYYSVSSSSSSSDLTCLSAIVLPFPGCLCFGTSAPPRRNLGVLRCRIDTAFAMMVNTSSLPPNDNNSSSSSGSGNGTSVMSSRQPFSGGGMSDDGRVAFGYASFQGKRATMEDFFDAKISKVDDQDVGLFGVFDGHGGSRAAEYLKKHLFQNLLSHPQFTTDTKLALTETYQQTDSEFLKAESSIYRDDGSTASTAVLVGDRLYVANVGDSRAVILKAGEAIQLSEDHKPNRVDERQRIEQAGGNVMWAGTWRVGGVLAVSRAFGNRLLKRFVVAEPEIQEEIIKDDVEFLVIASDGLWDVVSNEDAVELVKSIEDPEAAAIKLTETAYMKGSADNITCVVVRFNHNKIDFA